MRPITLYSQRDERWRGEEVALGYPFAALGHLTTCIAMLASLAGYEDTPPITKQKLEAAGAYVGRFVSDFDAVTDAYPELNWYGGISWYNTGADLQFLEAKMKLSPVVIESSFVPRGNVAPCDQHFVLAERFSGDDLEIIDPWTGTRCCLLERYALEHWDLKKAILKALLLRPNLEAQAA